MPSVRLLLPPQVRRRAAPAPVRTEREVREEEAGENGQPTQTKRGGTHAVSWSHLPLDARVANVKIKGGADRSVVPRADAAVLFLRSCTSFP